MAVVMRPLTVRLLLAGRAVPESSRGGCWLWMVSDRLGSGSRCSVWLSLRVCARGFISTSVTHQFWVSGSIASVRSLVVLFYGCR